MNLLKGLFLSSVIFASIGCAGTMQTARTNGEGNFQFGVEPGATVITSGGATVILTGMKPLRVRLSISLDATV